MDLMKTPRSLGPAREGPSHWWHQRISSIALAPLGLWFVISLVFHPDLKTYDGFQAWMTKPTHCIALLLLVLSLFYHGYLGLQVIIEDYIHHCLTRITLLLSAKFACIAGAVSSIFCVFKLALSS